MRRKLFMAFTIASLSAGVAFAQAGRGVVGIWREPEGSVLDVHRCGNDVCVKLVSIRANAPSQIDGNNPDPSKRSRPLCDLQVGWGFHLSDPDHADDGQIYDPRSGHTYHGTLTAQGDHLHLRGWAGFKIFGRTETWTRMDRAPGPCHS